MKSVHNQAAFQKCLSIRPRHIEQRSGPAIKFSSNGDELVHRKAAASIRNVDQDL